MDWQIIAQFGVPFMVLCGIALFLYKAAWPFLMRQYEMQQAQAAKAQDDFLKQLDKRDEITERQTQAIRELTEEVRRRK